MAIFIVDDNQDMLEFLHTLLSKLALDVHSFSHPVDALTSMRTHGLHPRLLITDYDMPALNGVELHQHMVSLIPELRTIVISGGCLHNNKHKLPFLQKPFKPEAIVAMARGLLAE